MRLQPYLGLSIARIDIETISKSNIVVLRLGIDEKFKLQILIFTFIKKVSRGTEGTDF